MHRSLTALGNEYSVEIEATLETHKDELRQRQGKGETVSQYARDLTVEGIIKFPLGQRKPRQLRARLAKLCKLKA